jgi:hypothetical protein
MLLIFGDAEGEGYGTQLPIQIVWEDVLDEAARIPLKIKENRSRKIGEQADRTWNLMTTLYYKSTGRIPWRKAAPDGEFTTCYIGVSFYREIGGQQLFTSAAQMFDERGTRVHPERKARPYGEPWPAPQYDPG